MLTYRYCFLKGFHDTRSSKIDCLYGECVFFTCLHHAVFKLVKRVCDCLDDVHSRAGDRDGVIDGDSGGSVWGRVPRERYLGEAVGIRVELYVERTYWNV